MCSVHTRLGANVRSMFAVHMEYLPKYVLTSIAMRVSDPGPECCVGWQIIHDLIIRDT